MEGGVQRFAAAMPEPTTTDRVRLTCVPGLPVVEVAVTGLAGLNEQVALTRGAEPPAGVN